MFENDFQILFDHLDYYALNHPYVPKYVWVEMLEGMQKLIKKCERYDVVVEDNIASLRVMTKYDFGNAIKNRLGRDLV